MSKSYAQMADEILNGALTDSTKNPYDPTQGHQASMPAMNPNDKLVLPLLRKLFNLLKRSFKLFQKPKE
jgi:hypothetical protein